MGLSDVLRSRVGAQIGWALLMALGAVGAGCILAGLPVYGWAHARLLRVQLGAAGVETARGGVAAGVLSVGALALVLAALVGAGTAADRPGGLPLVALAVVATAGGIPFVEAAAPLLSLPPRLLDVRSPRGLRSAVDASLHAPPLLLGPTRVALAVGMVLPATVLVAGDVVGPGVVPAAVALAVGVLLFGTAEAARRYADAPAVPPHLEDRGAPFTGWVMATLTIGAVALVPLAVAAFLPTPMGASAELPLAEVGPERSLPAVLDESPIELRALRDGVLVARIDGGGAGPVHTRSGTSVDAVWIAPLPGAEGYRIYARTEGSLERFELDREGVRRDDAPLARVAHWVGFQGGVLALIAVLAWTLATRRLPTWEGEAIDADDWAFARILLGVACACGLLLIVWVASSMLGG